MDRNTENPNENVESEEWSSRGGIHRVLVVADERFRGSDFLTELRSHMTVQKATVEVFVVAPALAKSALRHEMADVDEPSVEAASRLDAILKELKGVGINAAGHVGDGDPVTAVGDGLREFPADEIVVVSHPESQRTYGEKDLWERLKSDFRLPISDIEVPRPDESGAAAGVIRTAHEPAKARTEEETVQATRNVPQFSRRDLAGIVVGLVGTILIGMIAVFANTGDHGPIAGRNAAIILIAIGSFLLNGAHIVGLLFFESVHYTGVWDTFMARLALGFTSLGLVASLVLWLA